MLEAHTSPEKKSAFCRDLDTAGAGAHTAPVSTSSPGQGCPPSAALFSHHLLPRESPLCLFWCNAQPRTHPQPSVGPLHLHKCQTHPYKCLEEFIPGSPVSGAVQLLGPAASGYGWSQCSGCCLTYCAQRWL